MPHIGAPQPIDRLYEGSFGKAQRDYEAERVRLRGDGYVAHVVNEQVIQRRFLPDITRIEVRYEFPALAGDWTGARIVGDVFEVAWNDATEAKRLLKELRLTRKELVALKREQTGNATAARRQVRGTEAKAAAASPYVALADRYELRIRNLDAALRDIERWQLDN